MPPVKVVLADDTEALRYLIRSVLEEDGRFEVVGEARNGVEALDEVDRHGPDLLLLDLSMPVMDGLEVLDRLRRRESDTKVIVLSGYAAEAAAEASRQRGALAYIEKGVRPRDLLDSLSFLLELDGATPDRQDAPAPPARRIEPTPQMLSLDGVVNRLVHDLRSPVGLAAGYLELLEGTLQADDQLALAGRIRGALERLSELAGMLTVFTSETTGETTLAEVDVEAKLRQSLDELRDTHHDGVERVHLRPASSPTTVRAPVRAIEESFRSVLDNALKYGGDEPIDVAIEMTDDTITVTVADHGPGVDPDDEPLLFRPFARGSAGRRTPGAGLGLAISARLLAQMNGRIWAEPASDGTGLTIGIEVPRRHVSNGPVSLRRSEG